MFASIRAEAYLDLEFFKDLIEIFQFMLLLKEGQPTY